MKSYIQEVEECQQTLIRDAERYQWLRLNAKEIVIKRVDNDAFVFGSIHDDPETLDKEIDANISR